MYFCARAEACANELMYESMYICTVRAHKGFVQCASELVYISLHLRELCAVCMCTWANVRDYVPFVRCEPPKALCHVLVHVRSYLYEVLVWNQDACVL